MGTWNSSINGNDAFLDTYQNFFDLYNQIQNPSEFQDKFRMILKTYLVKMKIK
jgi:hypothetical protein